MKKSEETPILQTVVLSLFELSAQFVAKNIELVESLNGFPEIVGKDIFRQAENFNKFDLDNCRTVFNIQTFEQAYPDQVLSSLNISGCHLGLNYCFHLLQLFTSINELDVSSCGLGDNHDILPHISNLYRWVTIQLDQGQTYINYSFFIWVYILVKYI